MNSDIDAGQQFWQITSKRVVLLKAFYLFCAFLGGFSTLCCFFISSVLFDTVMKSAAVQPSSAAYLAGALEAELLLLRRGSLRRHRRPRTPPLSPCSLLRDLKKKRQSLTRPKNAPFEIVYFSTRTSAVCDRTSIPDNLEIHCDRTSNLESKQT